MSHSFTNWNAGDGCTCGRTINNGYNNDIICQFKCEKCDYPCHKGKNQKHRYHECCGHEGGHQLLSSNGLLRQAMKDKFGF